MILVLNRDYNIKSQVVRPLVITTTYTTIVKSIRIVSHALHMQDALMEILYAMKDFKEEVSKTCISIVILIR